MKPKACQAGTNAKVCESFVNTTRLDLALLQYFFIIIEHGVFVIRREYSVKINNNVRNKVIKTVKVFKT